MAKSFNYSVIGSGTNQTSATTSTMSVQVGTPASTNASGQPTSPRIVACSFTIDNPSQDDLDQWAWGRPVAMVLTPDMTWTKPGAVPASPAPAAS